MGYVSRIAVLLGTTRQARTERPLAVIEGFSDGSISVSFPDQDDVRLTGNMLDQIALIRRGFKDGCDV